MCEPATIAMAAIAAAGAYAQSEAQNDAADKQQKAINDALELQDNYARQAEGKALENADQYDAKERLTKLDEARTEAGQSLAQQLTSSREAAPQTSQPSGRLSQAFLTGDASAKADQLEKSINMAQLMGKMRGAGDMLTEEGYKNADYASQLGLIGRNAQNSGEISKIGIKAAGNVDSGAMLLGGIARGIGTSGPSSSLGKSMNSLFATKPLGDAPMMMGGNG